MLILRLDSAFVFHYNPAWLEENGRWEVVRPLGRGNFATVYLGMNSYTGANVAMKQVDSEKIKRDVRAKLRNVDWLEEANRVMINLLVKEVAKHMTVKHPHIVSVIGFHRDETKNCGLPIAPSLSCACGLTEFALI